MKRNFFVLLILVGFLVSIPMSSLAGVKMKIGDDTNVDLGFRVQAQYYHTDNLNGNGTFDSGSEFKIRRGRIRLGGNVTKWMNFFLQTEIGSGTGGSGYDMRLIDAWVSLNLHPMAKIYLGENMAPAGRQITTSSGGLMNVDRPGITNYNLTWGLTGRMAFNNISFADSDLALSNGTAVRDEGATLFGSTSITDDAHFKYYLGVTMVFKRL